MDKMLSFVKRYHKNKIPGDTHSKNETLEVKDHTNPKTKGHTDDYQDFLVEKATSNIRNHLWGNLYNLTANIMLESYPTQKEVALQIVTLLTQGKPSQEVIEKFLPFLGGNVRQNIVELSRIFNRKHYDVENSIKILEKYNVEGPERMIPSILEEYFKGRWKPSGIEPSYGRA